MTKLFVPLAPLTLTLALTACAPQVPAQPSTDAPATPVGSPATPTNAPATPTDAPSAGTASTPTTGTTSATPTASTAPSASTGGTASTAPTASQGGSDKPALPHEGKAGWKEESSGASFALVVCDKKVAAANATDSRVIGMQAGERGVSEGWISFEDTAGSQAFLNAVAAAVNACPTQTNPSDKDHRWVNQVSKVKIAGKGGVRFDNLLQMKNGGSWVARPGGVITLLAADGNIVAVGIEGSEGVVGPDDVSTKEVLAGLQKSVGAIIG